MKKVFFVLFVFLVQCLYSQVENVPLDNPVYEYLKEMQVKGIIKEFDDGNPNLSRFEVVRYLNKINDTKSELSNTENKLLERYRIEFDNSVQNDNNTFNLFKGKMPLGERLSNAFSNKNKHLFTYNSEGANFTWEFLGNLYLSKEIKPNIKYNAAIMDGGTRLRGTIFNHLGYYLTFNKGVVVGQKSIALVTDPRLKTDFKINEDKESNLNYDFTDAYLKYYINPFDNFELSAQFGREKITYGYGYGSKLILSGNGPNMDFLKVNAKFGIINYSFIHASTAGTFNLDPSKRYTKYWASQRLTFALDFANLSISDNVIYARPLEFAYLNPILFFVFAEKSLQDRDNKNFMLDFQTKFIKNLQFQGTLFIDDDEQFSFLSGNTNYMEKIGYQVGAFAYSPLGIPDLSFTIEYTKLRPYVYSHFDNKTEYTAYGVILGQPIGPNSDQIFSRITYNINDWCKLNLEYQFIRKGNNIYDSTGALIRNVGGNIFEPFVENRDNPNATFLDGERINSNIISASLRIIPIKNFTFLLRYVYQIDKNISKGGSNESSFFYLWMKIEY